MVMATMLTELTGTETAGERLVYNLLRNRISDDYCVVHNYLLHQAGKEIDFVILHPSEGVYVIEVKDWVIEQIKGFANKRVTIEKYGKSENVANPLDQAWNAQIAVRTALENNSDYKHQTGKFEGKLKFPVNYMAAMPNISAQEIIQAGLDNYLPPRKILDSELISGRSFSDRDIEAAIYATRDIEFNVALDADQWMALRIFFGGKVVQTPASEEIVGVLDNEQEKLSKYKLEQQILIEGPAGSGKSIVLVQRAMNIQELHPEWKIGIFCYNVVMANYLRTLVNQEKDDNEIVISHFNGISSMKLKPFSLDAILIDEGQDVTQEHLLKINSLLNPETASLTLFYDPMQAIYDSSGDMEELLLKTGFNIENTKQLVRQQRSVQMITALSFYEVVIRPDEPLDRIVKEVVEESERYFLGYDNPVSAIASGMARHMTEANNQDETNRLIHEAKDHCFLKHLSTPRKVFIDFIQIIRTKVEAGEANYNDFLIIYPQRYIHTNYRSMPIVPSMKNAFNDYQIPFRIIDKGKGHDQGYSANFPDFELVEESDNRNSADLNENVVKAMTVYSAKGLDAKYVAIMGFENIGIHTEKEEEPEEINRLEKDAALGYVALTRATKECYVYYITRTQSIDVLEAVLSEFSK
jgi:hypothetical protein